MVARGKGAGGGVRKYVGGLTAEKEVVGGGG